MSGFMRRLPLLDGMIALPISSVKRVGFLETGCDWIPFMLDQMDNIYTHSSVSLLVSGPRAGLA